MEVKGSHEIASPWRRGGYAVDATEFLNLLRFYNLGVRRTLEAVPCAGKKPLA